MWACGSSSGCIRMWRSAALAILCVVAITAMLYGQDRVAARIVLFSVITCAGMVATACVIVDGRRQIRTRGVALYLMLSILDWRRCTAARAGLRPGLGSARLDAASHALGTVLHCRRLGDRAGAVLALLLLVQTRMSERMQEALTFDSLTQASRGAASWTSCSTSSGAASATTAGWWCCCWTLISSRRSMTAMVTPPATRRCDILRGWCSARCAPATASAAWAARNSRC